MFTVPRIKSKSGRVQNKRTTAKSKKLSGKIPSKRTINLAMAGVETIDPRLATAGIILIIIAAAAFSKFFVADRLAAMFRAGSEVARLQSELNSTYAQIGSYGNLEDEYAHFTYSGMTEEERSLVDRSDVIRMIQREAEALDDSAEWTLIGNTLTINVSGSDLQQINLLARRLEAYEIVNTCTVTTAVKDDATKIKKSSGTSASISGGTGESNKIVRASITAYLQNISEGE